MRKPFTLSSSKGAPILLLLALACGTPGGNDGGSGGGSGGAGGSGGSGGGTGGSGGGAGGGTGGGAGGGSGGAGGGWTLGDAGRLIGVAYNNSISVEEVRQLDPSNGASARVGGITGLSFTSSARVADTERGLLYMVGLDDAGTRRLFTIDLTSGAVLASPLFYSTDGGTYSLGGGMFIRPDGGLAALSTQSDGDGGGTTDLVTIDPSTGSTAWIAAVPNATLFAGGAFVTDPQRRFLRTITGSRNGPPGLLTVDLGNGQVLSWPPIDGGDVSILFARQDGGVAGLTNSNPDGGRVLVAVDPFTGLVAPLAATGIGGVSFGAWALDAVAERAYVVGADRQGTTRLFALDVRTGAVLAAPTLAADATGSPFAWSGGLHVLP